MRANAFPVIDGDGHIMENASEMMPFMSEKYVGSDGQPAWARMYSLFPSLDGWTRLSNMSSSGLRDYPDCDMWVSFLDDCGIDRTVVYPTSGLGFRADPGSGLFRQHRPRLQLVAPTTTT